MPRVQEIVDGMPVMLAEADGPGGEIVLPRARPRGLRVNVQPDLDHLGATTRAGAPEGAAGWLLAP
jgi:hypothetical protein